MATLPTRTFYFNVYKNSEDPNFEYDLVTEHANLTTTIGVSAEAEIVRISFNNVLAADAGIAFQPNTIARLTDNIVSTTEITSTPENRASVIKNLSSNFSIDAQDVYAGDLISGFLMQKSFAMSVTVNHIESVDATLNNRFRALPFPQVSAVRSIDQTLVADFAQRAYPYGIFYEGEASLGVQSTVDSEIDKLTGLIDNFRMTFGIRDDSEFVDGQVRKFTDDQLWFITNNQSYIVDLVEVYINYADTQLPVYNSGDDPDATQWPLSPVYRWNSSGRDLDIIDYKGNTHNYKGKNVMMSLPAISYNGLFNKSTVKIQLNGLLGFFQKAITLGYLDYAKVVLGKAVYGTFDSDNPSLIGVTSQIDTSVVLLRGNVNNFVLSNNQSQQEITMEVTHGFYDYDLVNTVRTNSGNYRKYLEKINQSDVDDYKLGTSITEKIYWGSNTV